jgi:uncharacterized membrane protein YedE/YeeE
MHDFTPWRSGLGGVLIGLSASLLWLGAGRVAGISGIFGNLFLTPVGSGSGPWRGVFLAGLLAGAALVEAVVPGSIRAPAIPWGWLAASGLLVGVGTRLSGGCTSGHGVCGLSRLSFRSLVATVTFLATGVLTASLLHAARAAQAGAP